ncbi:glycoside hydrolase family 38 N-terminal domain-containing protein [Seonamhaeicola aphaedonensis]|uniref:Alpha-mannosidase n=1 Tax=Seonamhaeicola aphaedonensis TaxID=1461338 RepID=A0A3D9HDW9_9FLAO|nr:glycosyl hydrolase-related protein [Seonamhaeicola aphaedonensis]RED47461.1 alpha-mannosidase [Seonamhaeicola aphaedonensis]
MKKSIFLVLMVVFGFAFGQNTINITYVEPYEYKEVTGNLLAKASLDIEHTNQYKHIAFENGKTIEINQENTKVWVWLPVFGTPERITFVGKSRKSSTQQLFTPLVTTDWGYFKEGTFHIISSSHQDIAWMDTPQYCRHERIHDIIAPALDMMDTDNAFHFGMEQTLNLKEFIEEFPERKQEVMLRSDEGRFTWGATYNQPYEGMQTDEQLIREMYFGRRWLKKNFQGNDVITAFNTDVPGRTLQFPQILAKSGVENLFVSRLKEGFYNWYSPDGSSIPTYSPGNYGWAVMFYKLFEQDAIEAMHKLQSRVKMWGDYYKAHNLPPHFAIVISNDASGPANYGTIVSEWNDIIEKTGVKMPKLRHSTVTTLMNEIKKPGAVFETISGERPNIWSYIHGPGHAKAITASRKAGRLLPSAEIFASIDATLKGSFEDYPVEALSEAFEESIYPDHGWGGKNGHITDSIFRDKLEFAASEADRLIEKSLTSITSNIKTKRNNAVAVYNDLSWNRTATAKVNISDNSNYYVVDHKGKIVPSQISSHKGIKELEFVASNIPSLGYSTFYLKKGKKSFNVNKSITPNALRNEFYTIRLGDGGLTYLFDNKLGKEVIKTTRFAGGDIITMKYDGNGAGEFTQMTEPKMYGFNKTSLHTANWKIVDDGSVFTKFKNEVKFKHANIVQYIKVYHQIKKIDISVDILNWDGTHNREFRLALPLDMENSTIKYEVPLAIAEVGKSEMKQAPRGWAWGGTYDQKPVEIHPREVMNFISSEKDGFQVTLATDVALADWIDATRESVEYTVLQGILMATHKSCHGEGNWYHQTGDHHFEFSITSHEANDGVSYQFGNGTNHPLQVSEQKSKNNSGSLPESKSFFDISNPMVRVSTVKKAEDEDALVLRLVEIDGKVSKPTIFLPKSASKVIKTNLIEEEIEVFNLSGDNITIDIGNNAIETYKIILE